MPEMIKNTKFVAQNCFSLNFRKAGSMFQDLTVSNHI
jgi:hypothetical protein